jgi:hypothetical protein
MYTAEGSFDVYGDFSSGNRDTFTAVMYSRRCHLIVRLLLKVRGRFENTVS